MSHVCFKCISILVCWDVIRDLDQNTVNRNTCFHVEFAILPPIISIFKCVDLGQSRAQQTSTGCRLRRLLTNGFHCNRSMVDEEHWQWNRSQTILFSNLNKMRSRPMLIFFFFGSLLEFCVKGKAEECSFHKYQHRMISFRGDTHTQFLSETTENNVTDGRFSPVWDESDGKKHCTKCRLWCLCQVGYKIAPPL